MCKNNILFTLLFIVVVCFFVGLEDISRANNLKAVTNHTIKVDKNLSDWLGKPPLEENTFTVSGGEFIFKDAKGDDTGSGYYIYPTNKVFRRSADLREFRITFDKDNVYFLIRFNRPGKFWVPYCLIGIDQGKSSKPETTILAEGDIDFISEDSGAYAELKVAPELACEYVISVFSSYRGRIWNGKGELVAYRDGKSNDTPGFLVDDYNWSSVEVAVPIRLIGNPIGQTWHFIVATGLEEDGHLREIAKSTTEWHGGGGIGTGSEGEVDPDIYDLASPSKAIQEKELSSFNAFGRTGDPDSFATIKESYLTVRFAIK